ncbi:MAG: AMP-dependent synthetase [Cyanobacteria bacterium QH_9_48_43]|nr:MAG: AMP-dependent synthetase [Cyanobacteria bacterium QH_9_48_43]
MNGNFYEKSPVFSTWVDLLQYRAREHPYRLAYLFLEDGERETARLSYAELDRQTRITAACLQSLEATGERALLLHPPGLEFLVAFLGCLYAGVVAIPAYPPRRNQNLSRLKAIVTDSQSTLALATASQVAGLEARFAREPEFPSSHLLATDNLDEVWEADWQEPEIDGDTLAFLQYTSGSTGAPKGVMVTHSNLLHNERVIQKVFGHSEKTRFVSWLPLFHDMGLVGSALQPLYIGGMCALMSPVAFLQKPFRWLQAISHYRGTTSGAPNFAYDLCVRQLAQEQRDTLELSCWEVAFNGAEPIRPETLEQFTAKFAPCGFRNSAFSPCYGMAETTLLISGSSKNSPAVVRTVDRAALEENWVKKRDVGEGGTKAIASCGTITGWDGEVIIVAPQSLTECPSNRVGEIWVSGASVAQGYWHRWEQTKQVFHAYLADTGEGPFLRTGDLGFIQAGELFVTGRLKDVIIIRGRNHYPQDIELTVERSHPALRPGGGAAFSVEVGGAERLIIAQEVERRYLRHLDADEVVSAICRAVATEHELPVQAITLLKTASLPKTSSGKIQRHATREGFLNQSLPEITHWERPEGDESLFPAEGHSKVEAHVHRQIAAVLALPHSERLDGRRSLLELGLDSLTSVELRNRLQTSLGCSLPATLSWDYPTINDLIAYLERRVLETGTDSESKGLAMIARDRQRSEEWQSTSVEHLSSEQVEALLNEMLNQVGSEE